ncbi:WD40 repeat-like protein [Lindgomyces ingoldianus]|uniref:WD40 repeat-like protein n=1 Tax=Lindgomyces ingoldianus TaxID=673940 RepID=A0ACB6QR02_9PLEO|nr:WD40 repeat-like protein [Lindgomyces ingoldianus]KAF2469320.1 WD40 repeat-like protein [Lindgomyces ingoldianus]
MNFDDDDDNGAGSPDTSSENDNDEMMEDVDDGDADADADGDGDGDGDDGENDEDDGDGENDDDEQDDADTPSQSQRPRSSLPNGGTPGPSRTSTNPTVMLTSPSPRAASILAGGGLPFRPSVRVEALNAPVYDIVPTIAAPHSTSINAITGTPDMRWIFSGGADGYIRRFNWVDTANGKLALTVAQRHPFVDSVTKAGVLLSYWENEEPSDRNMNEDSVSLSPVYSLAVHHQSLWLLSGLDSGGINLQSVRHEEGKRITTLRQHTSAVSVLTLSQDEKSVLSGSWDKTINDWDLNTGQVKRRFETSGGQISAIEQRPLSSLPIPQDTETVPLSNGTFSSNNALRPSLNGINSNSFSSSLRANQAKDENGNEDAPGSPDDSLFGDSNSLFGDDKDPSSNPSALAPFGDDDEDEFSRAIANGIQQQADEDAQADLDMMDVGGPVQPPLPANETSASAQVEPIANGVSNSHSTMNMNGLPHSDEGPTVSAGGATGQAEQPISSETTFVDASHDGTLRIWDRRQPNPVARIVPPRSTPPWCMNACWSPDGNFIYAGRRNGTVDEYSLHKGLREPRRTFKFPGVSGAVSAVRAMPNGKHLVCASYDILRLYDLREHDTKHSAVPYLIVPGHRTGVISQLYLDPTCSFMISTGGNRGWDGATTEVLLGYEIGIGA